MKFKKIVLAGGSGYLGRVLANYYSQKAQEVVVLSRTEKQTEKNIRTVVWDAKTTGKWTAELVNADILINLCGKNVNCRYTDSNKKEILDSRVIPTLLLGEVISGLFEPPKVWINITSATIYRHAEDHAQDELTGEIGDGFSVNICKARENAFNHNQTPKTRKINLRMAIVLGKEDGVFPRLLNLTRLGLGSKQGNGEQYISWVHELDVARSTEWFFDKPELEGTFNCSSPSPVKNSAFMHILRKLSGMPFGLPSTAWLLSLGAAIIGTETELILKSRWVLPKRLQSSGFKFSFNDLAPAIFDILKTN